MVAIKIEFNTPVENGEGNELCIDFRYDEAIVVAPTEERALLEASRYVAKQGVAVMREDGKIIAPALVTKRKNAYSTGYSKHYQ